MKRRQAIGVLGGVASGPLVMPLNELRHMVARRDHVHASAGRLSEGHDAGPSRFGGPHDMASDGENTENRALRPAALRHDDIRLQDA